MEGVATNKILYWRERKIKRAEPSKKKIAWTKKIVYFFYNIYINRASGLLKNKLHFHRIQTDRSALYRFHPILSMCYYYCCSSRCCCCCCRHHRRSFSPNWIFRPFCSGTAPCTRAASEPESEIEREQNNQTVSPYFYAPCLFCTVFFFYCYCCPAPAYTI